MVNHKDNLSDMIPFYMRNNGEIGCIYRIKSVIPYKLEKRKERILKEVRTIEGEEGYPMTEYLKSGRINGPGKTGLLCGLIYILIMAGMLAAAECSVRRAAGDGLIAFVFVVSLAAMAVMTVISYPVRREKEIMQECGQGRTN